MKQLLGKHIPVYDVLKLMFYSLPFIIAQSAPFATLTGFLMCIGRMVSDNEILILRASGHSLGKIILIPVLILGLLISCFSFFVNDYLLPLGTIKTRDQLRKSISSNPTMEIERQSVKRLNNATVIFGDVEGNEISDVVFFGNEEDGDQRIIVAGKSKVESSDIPGLSMSFNLQNAEISILNLRNKTTYDFIHSSEMILNIFENTVFNFDSNTTPQEMTSHDLAVKIKEMKNNERTDRRELNMNILEYNKKWSLPFGSFFFAFLAMPLALLFGKHNGQTIGLVVGIFVSFFYWAMMTIGIQLGYRNSWNGFMLMWLPDFLVGFMAIIFYLRVRRR